MDRMDSTGLRGFGKDRSMWSSLACCYPSSALNPKPSTPNPTKPES